ncbi:MAG: hypothetical protein GX442_11065 [Candidatus Riflebacteria bacterium]|nr:hypothetical protein [Candidatus Riflebacteria bacterium]
MEQPNRSGLRELQIAQGLVALRWAAIPILFGFSLLATHVFRMSFQITPIYVLCCVLAVLNVFFTVHIALLSRQLVLRRGTQVLKRYLLSLISQFSGRLRENGIRSMFGLPRAALKITGALYLFLLESLRGVRFNLLSLDNIMHTQVIMDILMLTLLVRFTGSAESPLIFLSVIPVIVAGAVMGFYTGGAYAMLAAATYLALCLLINARLLTHIKFYGPQIGDLSNSPEWAISSFFTMFVALLGTAYLSHSLTSIFKERIFFLNQLLDKNRREAVAQVNVAEHVQAAWFMLDGQGTVLKYKRGRVAMIPGNLLGKNILETVPAFKQYGMGYVIQSVLTGGRPREIERIKFQAGEGTTHTLSCRLIPLPDSEKRPLILLMVDDITEPLFHQERVEELKHSLDTAQIELEKTSLEGKEANQQLMKTLKLASERSVEIQTLTQTIKRLESVNGGLETQVASLQQENAGLKSSNDALAADIGYKQVILEEVIELLKNSTQLDALAALIERRTKTLFKLDHTCLHIFRSPAAPTRLTEILDTRKASPRLLDLPRKNPKVLEPVLNEGQPVVIKAEVHPDKSAAMTISSGPVQRLVAYIPVRHGKEVLGMMMLERYGQEESPEKMISMLTYYLSHTAIALKNAIATRNLEVQQQTLTHTIKSLETQIEGFLELSRITPDQSDQPYQKYLRALGRICGAVDGIILRLHNDGTAQPLARIDATRPLAMRPLEEKVLKTLRANPAHKAVIKEASEGVTLLGYPLNQGQRLVGVLFMQVPNADPGLLGIVDVAAKLAAESLGLFVLNEEKELWENFYKANLTA